MAGISFNLNRHFSPVELSGENIILTERIDQILEVLTDLSHFPYLGKVKEELEGIKGALVKVDLHKN